MPDHIPPSETRGGAHRRGRAADPGTYGELTKNLNVQKIAQCDVRWVREADNKKMYTDFRRILDRHDIDLVAIATPPHWHALIAIAAAEAGKDVLGEKPMTRTMAEGRAMANAFKRYNRVYQVGTFGRFGMAGNKDNVQTRKLMTSGLVNNCKGVLVRRGGFKVKEWSGALMCRWFPFRSGWTGICIAALRRSGRLCPRAMAGRTAGTGIMKTAGWAIWASTRWTRWPGFMAWIPPSP